MADDDKERIAELERLIAVLEREMQQLQNDLKREMKAKRIVCHYAGICRHQP